MMENKVKAMKQTEREIALKIQNLSKGYTSINNNYLPVFSELNMEVFTEEIVAIMGPTGCGKSTLVDIITGQAEWENGDIKFPLNKNTRISVVWQQNSLIPWKTVHGNIEFPMIINAVAEEKRDADVGRLVSLVKLNDFSAHFPSQLSGGMKKRASIAAALASNPDMLILDEPFTGLDFITKQQIIELIRSIKEVFKISVIIVTHDVFEAICLADRIIVLSERPSNVRSIFENMPAYTPSSNPVPSESVLATAKEIWQKLESHAP